MSEPELVSVPPAKTAPPTPENVRKRQAWLDSITAYRASTAGRPWTFYEQIDKYLGPWGEQGYPIAYGKKYCILSHPAAYTEGGLIMVSILSTELLEAFRTFDRTAF